MQGEKNDRRYPVIKTIHSKLRDYWMKGPWWIPFALTLFSIFCVAMKPGLMDQLFGGNVDLTKRIVTIGQFQPHHWDNTPYDFRVENGKNLALACYPKMQFNDCLKDVPIYDSSMTITYAPIQPSWYHNFDGIILQVECGNQTLIHEDRRLLALSPKKLNSSAKFVIFSITIFEFILILILVILLGSGILTSAERLIGRIKS